MNPTDRIQTITNIALHLQAEYNTTGINMLLSGYKIPTENVSIVNSKRVYVIDLLKSQSNELIIQIASDLGLEVPEQIEMQIKKEKTKELGDQKIFISHSSLDIKIVEKVIDILEAIGVPSNKIFCSSFEGYGVKLGSDFLEVIKKELDSNVLVIFILSSNFYSSVVSLCEMGATWVKTNSHIPILIPPFEYDEIKGVIPTTHGMKINEKDKLNSLRDIVTDFIGLEPLNTSVWERRRDNVLKEVKKILDRGVPETKEKTNPQQSGEIISDNYYESQDEKIKRLSKKEWPNDFEMQLDYIQRQRKAIDKLINHNPIDIQKEIFKGIRNNGRAEWPDDFEMQLDFEQRQVESLRRLKEI
ncbi:toll/interleukin-1 receptor domain-containing protein [Litoribaculum gwangyangense]|uniref:TIR domain-containing protein n=1 Tax=Litoribaculum gwangyangense TaxID=1130722 RepID=A0ABP9CAV7_9FLAO